MSSSLNRDALLNEYKGSLFEFLVSKELACLFNFEAEFLEKLSENQVNMLSQQEQFLRNNYAKILISLPQVAKSCAYNIHKKLNISKIKMIQLVGMNAKANSEVDILIIDQEDNNIPISLKLSRAGSFTNTKSAGIKSFLEKYFSIDQKIFNQRYEQDYQEFAFSMYNDAGEEPRDDFTYWEELALPNLPGKLKEKQRDYLFNFYGKINKRLFEILKTESEKDQAQFINHLGPLTGFSSTQLIQVTCFYKLIDEEYQQDEVKIVTNSDLFPKETSCVEIKMSENSFEIILEKFRLQIRVKPMNKFTHKSYKVNCALKFN